MFALNVDLGQLIIGGLIAIVGYLMKRQLETFAKRLDKNEMVIFQMASDLQYLMGFTDGAKSPQNRRKSDNE